MISSYERGAGYSHRPLVSGKLQGVVGGCQDLARHTGLINSIWGARNTTIRAVKLSCFDHLVASQHRAYHPAMLHYWVTVLHRALSDFLEFMDVGQILYWGLFVLVSVLWFFGKHRKSTRAEIKENLFRDVVEELVLGLAVAVLIFGYYVIHAPYVMEQEAEETTSNAGQTLQAVTGENTQLRTQLTTKDGQIQTCGAQLTDAQKNVNDCLTQLGKANIAEPLKVTPFFVSLNQNPQIAAHARNMVVITNKIITPVSSVISCEGEIVAVGGGIANTATTMAGGGGPIGKHQYRLGISSPAWTPTNPLILTLYYNEDDPGACSISP